MRGRAFLRGLLQAFAILLITAVLLEILLRIFPGLVPPSLLAEFNPAARERIAERLALPTDRIVIFPPRDDGGPPRRLRIFRPFATVTWPVNDPGFVTRVTMDREGFCNSREPEPDPPVFLALGDSFTFCLGVRAEEAWPARLASLLGVPGLNLGSPGIGLYEHLQILKRFGIGRAPRMVILNLYEGNDLRDAVRFAAYRDAVGEGRQAPARKFVKDRPLARHSYAYNLIVVGARHCSRSIRRVLARRLGIPGGEEPVPDFRYRLRFPEGTVSFNGGNADTDEVASARDLRSGAIGLETFRQGLETFVALSRSHGFVPVVAYTPSAYTAYADFVEFREPSLYELMPWFSRSQRDFLLRKSAELGYSFLDLTPALQEAGRSLRGRELLYFPGVLHLTPRGHAVVAGAVERFLRFGTTDARMPGGALRPPLPLREWVPPPPRPQGEVPR